MASHRADTAAAQLCRSIRDMRRRREITVQDLSEASGVLETDIVRVEAGDPEIALGVVMELLYTLAGNAAVLQFSGFFRARNNQHEAVLHEEANRRRHARSHPAIDRTEGSDDAPEG
ncbi:hypothetical protein [Roseivivax isoporae]|uniref:hypothetical protein n=1 Tax=Roseivivax isoporae TaxID=591206 RepID=UPI001B7FE6C3|nr:hypothetical protein [Roseivivax isoporae]